MSMFENNLLSNVRSYKLKAIILLIFLFSCFINVKEVGDSVKLNWTDIYSRSLVQSNVTAEVIPRSNIYCTILLVSFHQVPSV